MMRVFGFVILVIALSPWVRSEERTARDQREVPICDGEVMQFRWIPPGSFLMGSPAEEAQRDGDEGPQLKVELAQGFYLGVYEVTQSQWRAVMGYNPAAFQHDGSSGQRPVESVSWSECATFLARLNQLGSGVFRFPTEAEWEYACRAGTTTRFPWGDTLEDWEAYPYAWTNSRSFAITHPVGQKPPNPWGLYDMNGNVWEWCSDWYGPYPKGDIVDPAGPLRGQEKVFRGGSWYDFPKSLRSANRHRHGIEKRYTAIGLRVVWEPGKSTTRRIKLFNLPGDLPLELVEIPAGSFLMGSLDDETGRQKDEGPQRKVTLSIPYFLGRFEVTQSQWTALMGGNPANFRLYENSGDLPVERVSWEDAQEFIKKLNDRFEGEFSLPTEAEWEYACRAGAVTRFPWGDDPEYSELNEYAWFNPRSEARSHPVGLKKPNAWGLYDMHGSVWEWCSDWFSPYPELDDLNPQGPSDGTRKIIRGGSWFNEPQALRSANRHRHPINSRQTNLGFRVLWRAGSGE